MKSQVTMGCLLLVMAGGLAPAQTKSPLILLQEALYVEETEGNLEKAIGLYEQVLEQAAETERLAARAAYQIGQCYLKKGDEAKAAEYFQKVVREYPDQKQVVSKAQMHLKKIAPFNPIDHRPFLVRFRAKDSAAIADQQQLLGAFNEQLPREVMTFRFEAAQEDGGLVGRICVSDGAGKDKIVEMLNAHPSLELIEARPVYTIVFEPKGAASMDGTALLELFHQNLPDGVSTYRYHSSQFKGRTRGLISTTTKAETDKLAAMVEAGNLLELVEIMGPSETNVLIAEALPIDTLELVGGTTTKETIKSALGEPEEEREKWLRYMKPYGIDFYVDESHVEMRLNPGFEGHFDNGISMDSTADDVFRVYGRPKRMEQTGTLMDKLEDRVLYRMGDAGKIGYEKENLLFWLDGDKMRQIVLYKGTVLGKNRNKDGKFVSVEKISSSAPQAQAEDLVTDGWALFQQQKMAEAEAKFKGAARLDAGNEGVWQGLGWAQFNQGKKVNAEASFKRCIKLNPKNAACLNGLGWIAHGQGQKEEAIRWWQKAVEAQPGATAALSGLAQTYLEKGEVDKAVHYYVDWMDLHNPQQPFEAMNRVIKEGEKVVEPLIGEMKTSNNWQIPKALGAIGDKRAVGPLIEKWQQVNFSPMKEVIDEALEQITGQQFETLEEWKSWWESAQGAGPS